MEVFVWRCVRHYTLIGGHQRLGGTSCRRLHVRSKEGRKMALNVKWTFIVGQYLLTPWNRVLLEQPTSFQLVKKFSSFYGNWRFITPFTSARQLSLSWASSIQSITPHPTSWRTNIVGQYTWKQELPKNLANISNCKIPKILSNPLRINSGSQKDGQLLSLYTRKSFFFALWRVRDILLRYTSDQNAARSASERVCGCNFFVANSASTHASKRWNLVQPCFVTVPLSNCCCQDIFHICFARY